jgi:hypothetical protein
MPGVPQMPGAPQVSGAPQVPSAEVWMSKELQLPVRSSVIDPQTGKGSVTEMKNIKPGTALDPAMFKVPPDFSVVQGGNR